MRLMELGVTAGVTSGGLLRTKKEAAPVVGSGPKFTVTRPLIMWRLRPFHYQAKGWTRARRVVAKVEWHQGELWTRVGFIVTNLTRPNRLVVKFYNGRGTAEQWIKIL
jgi:hypothetical protein